MTNTHEDSAATGASPSDQAGQQHQGKRKPSGFAGAPWYVISRVAAAAIAFGTLFVFTRVLDPANYGVYSLIISAGTLASTLLFGWIYYSLIRFYDATGEASLKPSAAYGMLVIVACLLAVITVGVWIATPSEIGRVVVVTALYSTGLSLFELTTSGLRVRRRPQVYAMAIIGKALLATGLGVALVLAGGGALGAVAGALTATLLFGFAFSRSNVSGSGSLLSLPPAREMRNYVAFGVPLALTAGGMLLLGLTARSLIAWKVDLAAVGHFAAAEVLCQRTLKMLMMSVNLGISVEVYKAVEQDGDEAARAVLLRYVSIVIFVAAPLFAVFVLAPDLVASTLVGGEFAPTVADYLPFMALSALLSGAQASYLAFAFLVRRKSWPQLLIFMATFLTNVGLALVLLPRMGAWGAVTATTSAWVVSTMLYLFLGRRWFRLPGPWRALRKMAYAIAVAAPLMIVANRLESQLLGLGVLALSGAVVAGALWVFDYPEVRDQGRKFIRRLRRSSGRARVNTPAS